MEEIWKPVPLEGYEEYYEVSNLGRIRRSRGGQGAKAGRIMQGYLQCGYHYVNLTANSAYNTFLVHRLVATAFIPNPENKPQVNHIDGNKSNNYVGNLEWVSCQENIQHAWVTGLHSITHHSEETRKKMSESQKGKHCLSEEHRQRISETVKGSIWVSNGIENRRIRSEELQDYLDNGYISGRLQYHSKEIAS